MDFLRTLLSDLGAYRVGIVNARIYYLEFLSLQKYLNILKQIHIHLIKNLQVQKEIWMCTLRRTLFSNVLPEIF